MKTVAASSLRTGGGKLFSPRSRHGSADHGSRSSAPLLLAADSYPRLGNHDWREADLLRAEALEKAQTAKPCADDPPKFARWLETF